jgi:hypothetical protein
VLLQLPEHLGRHRAATGKELKEHRPTLSLYRVLYILCSNWERIESTFFLVDGKAYNLNRSNWERIESSTPAALSFLPQKGSNWERIERKVQRAGRRGRQAAGSNWERIES